MTPKPTLEEAQSSMKPLTDFALSKNLISINTSLPLPTNVSTVPGLYPFFTGSGGALHDANGASAALSSRLVLTKYFQPENQAATSNALYDILLDAGTLNMDPILPLFIYITGSSSYTVPESDQPGGPGASSMSSAWRTSPWDVVHTRLVLSFNIKEPVSQSDRL
jgi:hypothetical protein